MGSLPRLAAGALVALLAAVGAVTACSSFGPSDTAGADAAPLADGGDPDTAREASIGVPFCQRLTTPALLCADLEDARQLSAVLGSVTNGTMEIVDDGGFESTRAVRATVPGAGGPVNGTWTSLAVAGAGLTRSLSFRLRILGPESSSAVVARIRLGATTPDECRFDLRLGRDVANDSWQTVHGTLASGSKTVQRNPADGQWFAVEVRIEPDADPAAPVRARVLFNGDSALAGADVQTTCAPRTLLAEEDRVELGAQAPDLRPGEFLFDDVVYTRK